MFGLSWSEVALTAFLLVIIIGAGRVPKVGESVGAFMAGYRKGRQEQDEGIVVREKKG